METNKHNKNSGTTFIEVLIYTGLLAVVLLVIYELFIQAARLRSTTRADNVLATDSQRIIDDFQQTIKNSSLINSPVLRNSAASLSLNNHTILYSLNNDRLEKNENGEQNYVNSNFTVLENLQYTVLGPSVIQPTVQLNFDLKVKTGEKERTESFQTAATLR